MEKVIGIDLGTVNSCVATIQGGTPVVISNKGGYKTTPSLVAYGAGSKPLVGQVAKRQAVVNADKTIYAFKRLLGRSWASPQVQRVLYQLAYSTVEGPNGDARVLIGDKMHPIPEISAVVLNEMKQVAEKSLNESVTRCVITVPAYFNHSQRQATKQAAEIAGLSVMRMVSEPVAAALAFGFGKDLQKRIAVFDLGGGTFDISILDVAGGVFEVLATGGDDFLGGTDFDMKLVDLMADNFEANHQVDLRQDKAALQRLLEAAEKAKIDLSQLQVSEVNLPFIVQVGGGALHLQRTLNRAELENATEHLVDRAISICQEVLTQAKLGVNDIDEVILVGGMTRMPLVQGAVKEFFRKDPSKNIHPDEAVAMGAAIQAAMLNAEGYSEEEALEEVRLLDVTSHNLGIEIAGGLMHTLIEKNSTLPATSRKRFHTNRPGQKDVRIKVFQGDERKAVDNDMLGEFVLGNLREADRGAVAVDITFGISVEGLVNVAAVDAETGRQRSLVVRANTGMDDDEQEALTQQFNESEGGIGEGVEPSVLPDGQLQEMNTLIAQVEKYYAAFSRMMHAKGEEVMESHSALIEVLVITSKQALEQGNVEALNENKEPLMQMLEDLKAEVESASDDE